MSVIVCPASFVYGVPNPLPVIPGYVVIADPDAFLYAECGGKRFLVQEFPTHFVLMEQFEVRGDTFYHDDQPIRVEKGAMSDGIL